MQSLARFFPKNPQKTHNSDAISEAIAEMSGGGEIQEEETTTHKETESSGVGTSDENGDSGRDYSVLPPAMASSCLSLVVAERKGSIMETPPADDVCPICFGSFVVPCRAPCGHWYCGGCILQYWNFSASLKPCKCPMCSQHITKLTPEASLQYQHEVEVTQVLANVGNYNRLYVGGISGFLLKFLAIPLYIKRMFCEMLNPDRPGVHLHELRMIALFLGVLYSFSPFDFLRIGRRNIIDVFDYSAFALSFFFYLAGLYVRQRRARNVRELAELQQGND